MRFARNTGLTRKVRSSDARVYRYYFYSDEVFRAYCLVFYCAVNINGSRFVVKELYYPVVNDGLFFCVN